MEKSVSQCCCPSELLHFILFPGLPVAATLTGTHQIVPLFYHKASAAGTFFLRWLLPGHEVTFRVILTAVVFPALLGLAQHHLGAALGAGNDRGDRI